MNRALRARLARIPRIADDAVVVGLAALARLVVVAWAAGKFPPVADGSYYHVIGERIARGQGYTWLWPDGAVTYAAHYPVGYPWIVAGAYRLLGPVPWHAMLANALIGVAGAWAALAVARRSTSRALALLAGVLVALHPALVAYTPALMTEGVTASLCMLGAWAAVRAREAPERRRLPWLAVLGLLIGACTLVRPQAILIAPFLSWFAVPPENPWRPRLRATLVACGLAALLCVPWVVRNELRMGHAGLSFNGGLNLLIGNDPAGRGGWAELKVPEACRLVFQEADKDACFGREAVKQILAQPLAWAALAPSKLAVTFDYCGGAGWYLRESNGTVFTDDWKLRLGAVETLWIRLTLLASIVWAAWARGPLRRLRWALAAASIPFVFLQHGWVAWMGLAAVLACSGKALRRMPVLVPATLGMVATTGLTHAVFFGSGRYSLVVLPFVTCLACGLLTAGGQPAHTPALEGDLADAPH